MSKVKLFFAGDFCSKPSTSYISVSDELVDLISMCDVSTINFEVPLKPEKTDDLPEIGSNERFFQNDDAPQFLRKIGFNLFAFANNHVFDWGLEGYRKTKCVLGADSFGSGLYDEAYKVKVVEVNGVRIGFLALTYSNFYGAFDDVLKHDGYACAYVNDLKVNHVIIEAKKTVDHLFVLPHDGIEYIDIPLPETMAKYRDFIEYGADGVIASHPHCPQGWEKYKGKPIFYSLGNFFFNSKEDTLYRAWNRPHWYDGLCVYMEIENGEIDFKVVNTKNTDNVSLSIDHSQEREEHDMEICDFIADDTKYRKRLQNFYERAESELFVVENVIHKQKIGLYLKSCFKKFVKMHRRSNKQNFMSFVSLIKHSTRMNLLLRTLNNK